MRKLYFLIFTTIFISCNSLETDVEKACELSCKNFEDVSKLQLLNLKFTFDSIENNNISNIKNKIEIAKRKISEIRNTYVDDDSYIYEKVNISYDSLLLNKCKSCFSSVLKKYDLSEESISKEIKKYSPLIIKDINNDSYWRETKGSINLRRTEKFEKRDYEVKIDSTLKIKHSFLKVGSFNMVDYKTSETEYASAELRYIHDYFIKAAERYKIDPERMVKFSGLLTTVADGSIYRWEIELFYNPETFEWKWSRSLIDWDRTPFPNNTLINNPKLIGETLGEYIAAEITEEAWAVDYFKNDSFETDIEFAWEGEIHNDTLHSQDNRWKYKGIINVTNNGFLPSAYSRSYSYGVDILFRDDDDYWSWELFQL